MDLKVKRNFCAPLHMAKHYHDVLALLHPFLLIQQTPGGCQISAPMGNLDLHTSFSVVRTY